MDWDDLRHFLAVAREGQILAAARRLGIGQATLNRRVSALEEGLGEKLFDRTPSGSRLTEAGLRLLPHAERMEAEAEALRRSLGGGEELAGAVRIGAPDGFGVAFLAPRLGRLAAQYPGLTVQLVPVPRSFSLSRREADLAVTVGRPARGRLLTRKLTDYRLGLYAARDYLDRHGVPQTPEDLAGHVLVGYVDDLIYAQELDFTAELPLPWASRIEVSGALGQHAAVANGAGIGILHRFMSEPDARLVRVLPEIELSRAYWLIWHETLRASRRVRAVAGFLDAEIRAAREIF